MSRATSWHVSGRVRWVNCQKRDAPAFQKQRIQAYNPMESTSPYSLRRRNVVSYAPPSPRARSPARRSSPGVPKSPSRRKSSPARVASPSRRRSAARAAPSPPRTRIVRVKKEPGIESAPKVEDVSAINSEPRAANSAFLTIIKVSIALALVTPQFRAIQDKKRSERGFSCRLLVCISAQLLIRKLSSKPCSNTR